MQYRFKRGTKLQNANYKGADGTISIDTENGIIYTHDNVKVGGNIGSGLPPLPPHDNAFYSVLGNKWAKIDTREPGHPGPQTFIGGDATAGFYGETSTSDLFTSEEIASATGISAGTVYRTESWLKFSLNGAILYIPKQAVRFNLSWEHIYQAGCVYGIDGTGPSPSGPAVNQLKIVTKYGAKFKVRLPTGASTNPSTTEISIVKESEWNKLMLRVWEKVSVNQPGPNWANYTIQQLTQGTNTTAPSDYAFAQETFTTNTANRIVRGMATDLEVCTHAPATYVNNVVNWRPVLEYIP